MTVREAFLALGMASDAASCHIGLDGGREGEEIRATYIDADYGDTFKYYNPEFGWEKDEWGHEAIAPPIDDRPAEAFLGFFGEAYDRVVQGETK